MGNLNLTPNSSFNANLGVVSSILVFIFGLFFFSVILLHADTGSPNVITTTICPKSRNAVLCRSVLKPASKSDALLKVANYTVVLAYTSALDGVRHVRSLAAATTDPMLKKRYSECSRRFDDVAKELKTAKDALAKGWYNLINQVTGEAVTAADRCFNTFKKPPLEPSKLPEEARKIGDISDIAVSVSAMIIEDY